MSYYQEIQNYKFCIPADKLDAIIKDLEDDPVFSTLDYDISYIAEYIAIDQWQIERGGTKDFEIISSNNCRAGDADGVVMALIAKYNHRNGFIEMSGEESEHWRWNFINGECIQTFADLVWPDPISTSSV